LSIITNLEEDHLEYFGGFEPLYQAFVKFGAETDGLVVLGIDDDNSLQLSKDIEATTVGFNPLSDWKIDLISETWNGSEFTVTGEETLKLSIPIPGVHNVKNAAIAAVASFLSGVEPEVAAEALSGFGGVARRFEHRGSEKGIVFVDDYAHLPSEVESTIDAASTGRWNRIVAVFQPHRFSRTETIGKAFSDSFIKADRVVITDVFAGGETPRPGISGLIVFEAVKEKYPNLDLHYLPNREELVDFLVAELTEGDLCLTMGAGDITSLPDEIKYSLVEPNV
jgi:UDP-N-acetylmuramate--alanine ligase